MNAKNLFLTLGVFLLAVASLAPLAAQQTTTDTYVVKEGDSAWKIAGEFFNSPTLWRQVVEKNPFLKEKGRVTLNPSNGWTYVMMHPGEELVGLRELGILPTKVMLSELGIQPTERMPDWGWWVLALAALLLLGCYLIYRMLTRDPATAREPLVAGGVTEEAAPARFQEMARINYQIRNGGHYSNNDFTILNSVPGHIWGIMNTKYADGSSIPRRFDGQEAFRALVQLPNGEVETLYMLQACGNDLKFGSISRYLPGPEFRFVPIITDNTPEGSATTTHSVPEVGVVRFELRKPKPEEDRGAMARITGIDEAEDMTCEIRSREVTLRFSLPQEA